MLRKRVPDVGSGDRKSSAADGSQSDWRHDQTVSSGRTQSSSTRDINSRGERPQIPWCVAVEDSVCQHGDFDMLKFCSMGVHLGSRDLLKFWEISANICQKLCKRDI